MSQDDKDNAAPVMLRAYHEGYKGATAFFRNRPFLDEFFRLLSTKCGRECFVLVHASSIGAEPYSLAMWWLNRAQQRNINLTIHATDLNGTFLEIARRGVYPPVILEGMNPEERSWFRVDGEGVHVPKQAKRLIQFLPPMSFVDGSPPGSYDAVLVMNALTYVTPRQQSAAVRNLARQTKHILALTAFHPDTIQQDLQENGLCSHSAEMEAIHNAWGDRLANRPIDPASEEYSWKLPPFDLSIPDAGFRYCSLFTLCDSAKENRQLTPDLIKAVEELVQFGIERHRSGDIAGAQALYGKALELAPTHPVALHNLGLIFMDRGDLDSAVLLLGEAARQRPTEAAFLYSHALALQKQGKLHEALQQYDQAVTTRPALREAWENRGVALQDLEQFDAAIDSYRHALRLSPDSPVANRNLGNALRVLGRLDEAIAHYRGIIAAAPLNAEIQFGLGATLITRGEFDQGWPLCEWRFWSPEFLETNPPYRVPLPHWDGGDLGQRSLLVYGEQGIGDEIMFASCLKDLSAQAGKLTVLCQPRLVSLFSRSFPGIKIVAKTGDQPGQDGSEEWMADVCTAIGSLPQYFRRSESSFPGLPYLLPDRKEVEFWSMRLGSLGKGLKVGISWRGGAETRARNARSITLERFSPLVARDDVALINIQYGQYADEIDAFNRSAANPLISFPEIDPLQDMDGFASLLSSLDLVITVDNSTAHLAGALGVPTLLLLPAHADWRWLKGREDTPWYRSLKIFWQREHRNAAWDEVIARLDAALNNFIAQERETIARHAAQTLSCCTQANSPDPQHKPVALLLNDTSYWYHWGCTATTLALHDGLRTRGYRVDSVAITVFNQLTPLPFSVDDFDSEEFFQRFAEANPALADRMLQSDVVVINGEGTLHGLGRTPLALLYTAYAAKRWLGKATRIVNHSCYPHTPADSDQLLADRIYRLVYSVMDYVAVRESRSSNALAQIEVHAAESFDSLPLYVARHGPQRTSFDQPRNRIVMAGSVALNPAAVATMADLGNKAIERGYELQILVGANAYLAADDILFVNAIHPHLIGRYTLVSAHSESAWLGTISGAALLISGRFHHSIAAACLGTPLAVASSNTQKIEGLIDRLKLDSRSIWLDLSDPLQANDRVGKLLDEPQAGIVAPNVLASLQDKAELNFAGLRPKTA